ncbi:MAG: hypothetical protein ACI4A5_04835, partial [Hominilimicola sp.]
EKKCSTPHLDEEKIKQVFVSAMNKLITSKEQILSDFEIIKEELFSDDKPEKKAIDLFIHNLKRQDEAITEFDENLWLCLAEYVTVYSKEDIQLTFKNGVTVKV